MVLELDHASSDNDLWVDFEFSVSPKPEVEHPENVMALMSEILEAAIAMVYNWLAAVRSLLFGWRCGQVHYYLAGGAATLAVVRSLLAGWKCRMVCKIANPRSKRSR
jgi:hypothetical protein